MTSEQQAFIRRAAPGAQRGFKQFGVPASVTIAQAILESGWGKSHMGSANNYFGIKAHEINGRIDVGPIATGFVEMPTKENVGGGVVTVVARFRKYASMAASMRDHGRFLRDNPRYKPAFAVADDANAFARALQRAGYATDPKYADKLIGLMKTHDLYRFNRGIHPGKPKPGGAEPEPGGAKPKPGATRPKPKPKPKPVQSDAQIRARLFVAGLQRDLNERLMRLGSSRRLAVDGTWDPHTARAFEQICRVLGIEPERSVRTFRVIAGATDTRTQQELDRAAGAGAEFAQQLKARFEQTRGVGVALVGGKPLAEATRTAAYVAALQRDLNAHLRRLGSPRVLAVDGKWDPHTERAFAQVCTMLGIAPKREVRTFRLIAGAAAVPRTKQELARAAADGAALEHKLKEQFATARASGRRVVVGGRSLPQKERAKAFVAGLQRDLNTQLKWLGATRLLKVDGTWEAPTERAFQRVCTVLGVEPKRDVRTFRVIAGATAARSQEELQRAAQDGVAFEQQLKAFFAAEPSVLVTQVKPPPGSTGNGSKTETARTFRVRSPELKGDDVKAFQRVLNQRYKRWGVGTRIDEDREYGTETRRAARQVAFGLGIAEKEFSHGFTPAVREKIRSPRLRTPAELARAERRRDWLRRLKRRHDGGGVDLALAFARKQLGLQEAGGNRGALVDKWNRTSGSPLGSPWCGNFMNACLMAAGFPSQPFLAACKQIESHARAGTGGWLWTGTPRPGDLVLYTIDGAANHVGMVESVTSTQVITIEGNTRKDGEGVSVPPDGVERRHRARSLPRGYARPPYAR